MTSADSEPLDPASWFSRLRRLDAMASEGAPTDRLIRVAYHLARLAPMAMRDIVPSPYSEEDLDAVLDCDAHEHAMLRLIGPKFALHLEKLRDETVFMAIVGLDSDADTGAAQSEDCATAVLMAWVRCLTNLQTGYLGDVTYQARHKSLCGSPPSSTEH